MSLILNGVLLVEFGRLAPDYRAYWDARTWISKNVLRRPRPDPQVVFQSDEFTSRPAARPGPQFRLDNVLQTDDPDQLQAKLRKATVDAFGIDRVPRGDLDFRTHSSEELPSYTRHKVSYQTQAGVRIPAYMLEPRDVPPPRAAVLVIHGCGYGKAGPAGLIDDYHNSIGVDLVQAGYLVLVPDLRGFGELQPVPNFVPPGCGGGPRDGRSVLESDATSAFGTSLGSLDVFDLLVAVDHLASRPDVKAVGLAGLSGGGVVASYGSRPVKWCKSASSCCCCLGGCRLREIGLRKSFVEGQNGGCEVSTSDDPFVVLLSQDGANEAAHGRPVRGRCPPHRCIAGSPC